jgi:hypothetical protein
MTDKTATAKEIASIEELIVGLETRLRRLAPAGRREEGANGSSDLGGFVSDAVERIKKRVRDQTGDISRAVADEASRIGSDALREVIDDVLSRAISGEASHLGGNTLRKVIDDPEYRPLLMLALAGGIGYLAGRGRLSRGAEKE